MGTTPILRNEFVLSKCQHVVCGYVNKNGSVFSLLAGQQGVINLIEEDAYLTTAEPEICHERWTVAQDKTLLRMYYADMGIHAIHKQLHKTYVAVYSRIHSITQPEELLKGREFEDHVLSLFHTQEDGELVLQEWQGDKSYGMIQPENNSNPDFVFRYGQKEFAVECKWREKIPLDLSKDLFPLKRIENYRMFSETRKLQVSIVLGIGGDPCYPEQMYVIPLERINSVVSNKQSLADFLYTSRPFNVSLFVHQKNKPKEKVYTIDEIRKQYPNAYKLWSKDDDERLLILVKENKSIKELIAIFKRNKEAIRSRINKLTEKERRKESS